MHTELAHKNSLSGADKTVFGSKIYMYGECL